MVTSGTLELWWLRRDEILKTDQNIHKLNPSETFRLEFQRISKSKSRSSILFVGLINDTLCCNLFYSLLLNKWFQNKTCSSVLPSCTALLYCSLYCTPVLYCAPVLHSWTVPCTALLYYTVLLYCTMLLYFAPVLCPVLCSCTVRLYCAPVLYCASVLHSCTVCGLLPA